MEMNSTVKNQIPKITLKAPCWTVGYLQRFLKDLNPLAIVTTSDLFKSKITITFDSKDKVFVNIKSGDEQGIHGEE